MCFFAALAPLQSFALLMRGELGFAAELDTARFCAGASLTSAGADQFALELSKTAQYGQHQSTVRRRGVGPRIAERTEARFLIGNRGKGVEQVACRAREPIKTRHHHHIAAAELAKQSPELGAIRFRAARHFAVHLFGTRRLKRRDLRLDALAVCLSWTPKMRQLVKVEPCP